MCHAAVDVQCIVFIRECAVICVHGFVDPTQGLLWGTPSQLMFTFELLEPMDSTVFRLGTYQWNLQGLGLCYFSFPSYSQIVFQSDFAILHSLTHYMSVSMSAHLTNTCYCWIVSFHSTQTSPSRRSVSRLRGHCWGWARLRGPVDCFCSEMCICLYLAPIFLLGYEVLKKLP